MLLTETHRIVPLPRRSQNRLTYRRLRRPTRLPGVSTPGTVQRYLDRLRWLFGGE